MKTYNLSYDELRGILRQTRNNGEKLKCKLNASYDTLTLELNRIEDERDRSERQEREQVTTIKEKMRPYSPTLLQFKLQDGSTIQRFKQFFIKRSCEVESPIDLSLKLMNETILRLSVIESYPVILRYDNLLQVKEMYQAGKYTVVQGDDHETPETPEDEDDEDED